MEPITLTLCLLVFAIAMFVWEKIPLAVTSMVVCVALVLTGVLDMKQAFAGFIDTNVILFVAMFIVGGALFETGMANKVGGVITLFAKTEKQLIFTIMVVVGVMSGFLQYRYRSGADSRCYRRRGEIWFCPFPPADAAGFRCCAWR